MTDDNTLNAWMAERINESIPDGNGWTSLEVAEKLIAKLEETEPERFSAWMHENTLRFLKEQINKHLRSIRYRTVRAAKKARFNDAAKAHEAGDASALDPYKLTFVLDEDTGEKGELGEMRGIDCGKAKTPFGRRRDENDLWFKFLEALERKCGRRKVKNVYTREQLNAMFSSFGLE